MRKLASIQRILELQPIEGKDKIELATVLGWKVVVQKNEFKVNDLCVYIEADSLLPEREEFEFLRKRCYSKKYGGFRIRVMKLGTIYSQGIVFPISILKGKVSEGQDVSEQLNVRAYDPDELKGIPKKKTKFWWFRRLLVRLGFKSFDKKAQNWPNFAIKSDETRLGAVPEILNYMYGKRLYVSEKIDGQSSLYFYYKGKFGVCSRNVWLVKNRKGGYDNGQYFEMAEKYDLETKLKKLGRNIGIQGEIVGPGIQGNKLQLKERELYVYQIQDLDKGTFLNADEMRGLCEEFNLKEVPIIFYDKYVEDIITENTVDNWTSFAVRKSEITPEVEAEGIVVRTMIEESVPNLMTVKNRLSFKVINPEFILKFD